MTAGYNVAGPSKRCVRHFLIRKHLTGGIRLFNKTSRSFEGNTQHDATSRMQGENYGSEDSNNIFSGQLFPIKSKLNPNTVTSSREERQLMRSGNFPLGSRRRRAVLRSASVEERFDPCLAPYHCFQEARKVLSDERKKSIYKRIGEEYRISGLRAQDLSKYVGGKLRRDLKLKAMEKNKKKYEIEEYINDPMIKKMSEDGVGNLDSDIFRHLAQERWRSFRQKVIVQRIDQFAIVPDLLPAFEPTASVDVAFKQHNVQPGNYVDSRISEHPARLKVQVFDKGERLVSVVMIDSDVPAAEKDDYVHKYHYFAVNIPLSPTNPSIAFSLIKSPSQLVLPWIPPFAQKGTPYHRYSIFVLQQPKDSVFDARELRQKIKHDDFLLRKFAAQYHARPIGLGLFRSIWDEGTAGVMHRASIKGADLVYKRKKVIALKLKQKPRGWEAKRAHPKYDAMLGRNRPLYRKTLAGRR